MHTLISNVCVGDSILLSGAAVELARRHGKLRVPAYTQYMESVRSFYVNHPEITVYEVENPPGSSWGSPPIECFKVISEPLACGVYGPHINSTELSFSELFYKQLGVDYAHRWDSCPLQNAWKKTGPQVLKTPAVFVHDDPERGYVITKGNVPKDAFRPSKPDGSSILRYAYALAQSQEVHVIDSAFFWLADSIDTFGQLFLHAYAKGVGDEPSTTKGIRTIRREPPTRKKWTIIR